METIEKAYEKYKLQWLIDHGFTIENLIRELEEARQDFHPETPLTEVFAEWEKNTGFGGQIWACEDEYSENEVKEKPCREKPITLPFGEGKGQIYLVAEDVGDPDYGPEIVVGISDKNDNWLQNLAIVRLRKDNGEPVTELIISSAAKEGESVAEVLLYEDENDEDYTSSRKIHLLPQSATAVTLPEGFFNEVFGKLTPEEALVRSISDMRKVDMRHMEDLTGLSMDDLMIALRGKIYMLPDYPHDDDGYPKFTTAGEYLSGSREILERRLADAINYAEMSEAFDENIIALQKTLCGMSFSMDPTSIKGIDSMGGRLDKYGIPHFDAEVFKTMQHTGDSVTYPGKKSVMIPGENGPALIIEGINFLIDNRKE